jgi:hypothetical protein
MRADARRRPADRGGRCALEGPGLGDDGHLKAVGQPPRENIREGHELSEIARVLSRFEGVVSPPLPHGHGLAIRQREDETAARMREERAAA